MTPVAVNDSRAIYRIQLTGDGRWISLALSLGDLAPGNRFLVGAERVLFEMAALDEPASQYGLVNWQGGAISGARYAFRALKVPIRQVCLHELRGQLSSGDVWVVSAAAALAVARLLGRSEVPVDLGGWKVESESRRPQGADGVSPSPNAASAQPATPPERAENHAAALGATSADRATQDIPAEPSAAADRPAD